MELNGATTMTSRNSNGGDPKHGIVLPNREVEGDADQLVEYAVAAEAAGWDGVFLADHLVFPPSRPDENPPEYGPFPDP